MLQNTFCPPHSGTPVLQLHQSHSHLTGICALSQGFLPFRKPSEPYAKGLFLTINKRRLHLVARSFRLFCKSSCLSNKAFRFFLFAASWSSHKIRKPLFLTLLFFYLKPYNLCLEPNNVLSQASLPYVTTPLPSFFSGNRHILPCSTAGHRLC